jgi:Mn-dependent DtxR family transcriptional regulator
MHIQESGEMYLETIFILSRKLATVRSVDVAEHLSYSKPSVSRAMGIFKNGGYITMDAHGALELTASGKEIAEKIYERHTFLTKFLMAIGVDEATASEDACKIEHVISDTAFEAMKRHAEKHSTK